ncbi:unnamed protein product [Lampetra fluviatilis]
MVSGRRGGDGWDAGAGGSSRRREGSPSRRALQGQPQVGLVAFLVPARACSPVTNGWAALARQRTRADTDGENPKCSTPTPRMPTAQEFASACQHVLAHTPQSPERMSPSDGADRAVLRLTSKRSFDIVRHRRCKCRVLSVLRLLVP